MEEITINKSTYMDDKKQYYNSKVFEYCLGLIHGDGNIRLSCMFLVK